MWDNLRAYQASLSKSLYPSRLEVKDAHCHFRAKTTIRNFGGISLVKAHANSSFILEPLARWGRRDDSYVLHMQLSGQSAYTHCGGEVACASDTVVLTNVQDVILAEQCSPADALVVKIPGSLIRDQIKEIEDFCWITTNSSSGSADILRNFVLTLWDRSEYLDYSDHKFISSSLFKLMEAVFHRGNSNSKAETSEMTRLYRRLRHEISVRLNNSKLTVNDLANEMGMSRSKLYRLTSQVGTTVERLIIDIRLDHAAKLLAKTGCEEASLTTLAFDVGFCDLAHFSRCFKRKYGVSPSAFRSLSQISPDGGMNIGVNLM